MLYQEVDWTAEQINFTLHMILDKFINGSETELKVQNVVWGQYKIYCGDKIYVEVKKSRVFMILNNQAAGYYCVSRCFWKDRPVKATIKKLIRTIEHRTLIAEELERRKDNEQKKEAATRALFGAFPEAITKEFEKHILENKDECSVVPRPNQT